MKRYATILADPPWAYRDKMMKMKSTGNGAAAKYGCLSIDEIAHFLRTGEIVVAENAHLWLWTTNAHIVEAHAVARTWGFAPKTIVTWVKGRIGVDRAGTPHIVYHIGQGRYVRNATEHLVFAVRGKCPPAVRNIPTAFLYPGRWNGRMHSEKPPIVHEWAERLSPGPRLELFARRRRDGWTTLGDEVAA